MYKIFLYFLLSSCLILPVFSQELSQSIVEEKTSTQNYPVGELGTAWQFPSDHLPIGGSVGNVHFVLWNILHTEALHHIIDNSQGLRESSIITSNIPADSGSLTVREEVLVKKILEMVNHPTHPRSLIALQETSEQVFEQLQEILPSNMKLLPSEIENLDHGDVFIYDSNIFHFIDFNKINYIIRQHNTIMTLTLVEKKTELTYKFVQSHVPGGPIFSVPARKELANAVMKDYDSKAITIIMGDMNRSPDFFLIDFQTAAAEHGLENQPFVNLWIPYATHINTHREAAWIDNLFFSDPYPEISIHVTKRAPELFESLQITIDLLESLRYK